jgi:hypothetical protein
MNDLGKLISCFSRSFYINQSSSYIVDHARNNPMDQWHPKNPNTPSSEWLVWTLSCSKPSWGSREPRDEPG